MRIYKLSEDLLSVPEYNAVIRSKNREENEIEGVVQKIFLNNPIVDIQKYKELLSLNNLCTNRIGVFLTTACQLKCKYCYYDSDNVYANRKPEILNKLQMVKILDMVFDSAKLISCITKTEPFVSITISGGGEPTLYWENFKYFVDEARKREEKRGITTEINLVCNGILNEEQQKFIVKNISHVTFSYDGLPDIQREQRCGGHIEQELIESSLKFFSENDYNYTVRVTVLPQNVARISEICEYLFDNYTNLKKITFEPVAYSGRAEKLEQKCEEKPSFLVEYIKAYSMVQKKYGKKIGCSLFPDTLKPSFCGAWLGASPWIDAEGYIMPCNERMDRNIYSIGKIDKEGKLEYYKPGERFHRELRSEQIEECKDCMASYYCNGGCPIVFARDKEGNLCTESAKENCKMVSEYWKKVYMEIVNNKEFLSFVPHKVYTDNEKQIEIFCVRERES